MNASTAGTAGPLKDTLSAALERAQSYSKGLEFTSTSGPCVTCPSCGYDMSVTSVAPAFLGEDWEDISYTCRKCGTQIQRTVKSG